VRTIRLTAEEQEYARVAGISDVEYARQKQKLAQAKAAGDYGERR
jgi:nucleoid-associated protein YgaU